MSAQNLSEDVKQQIVLAAATVAGPTATPGDVAKHVTRIAGYLNPNSEVQRAFAQIDKVAENTVSSAGFVGTIIGIAKEESSKRGVVMFYTGESTHNKDGKEHLRTEILEGDEDARALMNLIKGSKGDPEKGIAPTPSLIGHKVGVSFDRVKKGDGSGHQVRVLKSVSDRGADSEYNFENPAYQPAYDKDEQKKNGASKLVFYPRVPALV
ncbi:hypothetical protein [Microbacterium sp. 77mftsu3.1]|uniref:hypothetical protein n=1 Tax=Microbacterium sp. 77mftsu3.1 TaxID=1761802 RepID=UPI0003771A43|nr:hypothetical protein [Microbacterium sp. 77mftsu3.1]SDH35179.1 hypothetical protein SAMN04488590_3105 [Microbacterium sp. 77mftsu3.1]